MKNTTIGMRAAMMLATCGSAACVLGLGGCESSGPREAAAMGAVGNRPQVASTAVESAPVSDAGGLGFFDELESKPLASQDDAIHAMLLLGTGTSAASYEQRVGMAKALGYVEKSFNQPARQAVTMGEIASMATHLLEGKTPGTQEDAMARLVHREIAPASAKPNQGLTGAQLVSMAGGVRDAMALEGVPRVPAPTVWAVMAEIEKPAAPAPTPAPAAAEVAAAHANTPAPAAAASAAASKPSVGHSEPIPPEATGLTSSGVSLNEASKVQPRQPIAVVATIPPAAQAAPAAPAGETAGPGASLKPMAEGLAASNVPPALQGKGRAEPLPQIPVGTVPPAIELQDPNAKGSVIGPDAKVISPGQPKGAAGSKVNTTKPAPKPAPKKDAPKDQESEWSSGKPLKPKTAGADEPK